MIKQTPKNKKRVSGVTIISFTILLLGLVVMILPFLWMVLTSFKTYEDTMKLPIVWFPEKWTLDNYQ